MYSKRKARSVYSDELYLDNINLVTGSKINSSRGILTDQQVRRYCVDPCLGKVNKFLLLLREGDKMQVWSIFESLGQYLESNADVQCVFQLLLKELKETIVEHLDVLGQGVRNFLIKTPIDLSPKAQDQIFELIYRVIETENPKLTEEWVLTLRVFIDKFSTHFKECVEYINGSMSMKASPQRRKICFMMINILSQARADVLKSAEDKVLFFYQDHDSLTRKAVCKVTEKLLAKEPKNEDIWKVVWEYFADPEISVRQQAVKIICKIHKQDSFENILYEIEDPKNQSLFAGQFKNFIRTYFEQCKQTSKQYALLSFLNRILKTENCKLIQETFSGLEDICKVFPLQTLEKELELQKLNIEKKQILLQVLGFYPYIDFQSCTPLKKSVKALILKGLKHHKYEVPEATDRISQLLNLFDQKDVLIFFKIILKMVDDSKWHAVQSLIPNTKTIQFTDIVYENMVTLFTRLMVNCPYYLLASVFRVILHLALINRKSVELFPTLREKLYKSKTWSHRRNYIMLYAYIKSHTSLEFQKAVPIFSYRSILAENICGVKLEFLSSIREIYLYSDFLPRQDREKDNEAIKEVISQMANDKDTEVAEKARLKLKQIKEIDQTIDIMTMNERNSQLLMKQLDVSQITIEKRSSIKTEKEIRVYLTKKRSENTRNCSNKPLLALNTANQSLDKKYDMSNFITKSSSIKTKLPLVPKNRTKI